MPPIGQVRTHTIQGQLDFKYLKNVPHFAEEDSTNQNIINKVNEETTRATSEETRLNTEIVNLKLNIQDAFGGTLEEIKEVYGNLGNVRDAIENVDQVMNVTSQPSNNLQTQVLSSRINNIEQLLFSLQK